MARAGRRLKLTEAVIDDIASAISIGATEEMAAGYARISWMSLHRWLDAGEAELKRLAADPTAVPDPDMALFCKLCKVIEQSRADAGIKWLQVVDSAANKDPQWAAWMLGKKFPEAFGTNRQQLVGADGKEVVFRVVYGDSGESRNPGQTA